MRFVRKLGANDRIYVRRGWEACMVRDCRKRDEQEYRVIDAGDMGIPRNRSEPHTAPDDFHDPI